MCTYLKTLNCEGQHLNDAKDETVEVFQNKDF